MSINGSYAYKYYTYLPLMMGVISGGIIFIIYLLLDGSIDFLSLESNYFDYFYTNSSTNTYIINQRIIIFILFLIITLLFSYYFAAFMFNYILGIYYMLFSVYIIIEYGIKGMLGVFVLFLPFFMFYFYSICLMGKWFFSNSDYLKCQYERFNNINFFVKIILLIVMLLVGMAFEVFFQKNFIKFLPIYSS